ncbi:MAG: T9SS type A sorting domain-containing protein [Rhodothermales bacterium]|nr:T9SS type A sorting domain-containing protein [Rhodothermales bacterium]
MRYLILLCSLCLTVVVQAQDTPVARDDFFNTAADSTLAVEAPGVLENDSADAEIEAVVTTPPPNGTLSLSRDGSFEYTPKPGFSGTDLFSYVAETKDVPEQFVIDPLQSGARLSATLSTDFGDRSDSDTSAVSGTLTAEVVSNTEPFTEIHVTAMNLVVSDALSLTFDYTIVGSIVVSTDADSLSLGLATPGLPAAVSNGSFSQDSNQVNLKGTLNIAPTGLLANVVDAGPQTLDVSVPAAISGTITQNGSELRLAFPLLAEGTFEVAGNTVAVSLAGEVVATGPVVVPKVSNVATVGVIVAPSGVGNEDTGNIAREFALGQNYPNPVNQSTAITWQLPAVSDVSISLFDALGREVMTIVDGVHSAGIHRADLDVSVLPVGLYVYRLRAGSHTDMKKFIIVR